MPIDKKRARDSTAEHVSGDHDFPFPHLGDAFDQDELPIKVIVAQRLGHADEDDETSAASDVRGGAEGGQCADEEVLGGEAESEVDVGIRTAARPRRDAETRIANMAVPPLAMRTC